MPPVSLSNPCRRAWRDECEKVSPGSVRSVAETARSAPDEPGRHLQTSLQDFIDSLMLDGFKASFLKNAGGAEVHLATRRKDGASPERIQKTVASSLPCIHSSTTGGGQDRPLLAPEQLRRSPAGLTFGQAKLLGYAGRM